MRNNKTKRIVLIVAAAILIPLAIAVGANEIYGILSGSSFSSFITFFNAKAQETALYVQKEVVNTNDDYPAPADDEFEFVLKLNGSVARDTEYTLYDSEGRKIFNYPDGETTVEVSGKMENARLTDRYGRFTLKAGQTAKFAGLSSGDTYEVTESSKPPYVQIQPAEGTSATGTLTAEGLKETITNLYPDVGPGKLQVRKTISYPDNYELPETPDFTFVIKIQDEPYSSEFTIKDADTNQTIGTAQSDANGQFTLKGDTYAEFANVPLDVDYSVSEIINDELVEAGWRLVGDDQQEGATSQAGNTVNFTNVLASFAVNKTMFGGAVTDDTFEFKVLDGRGNGFGSSIAYYLYDSNKQLVTEELQHTGTDGSFVLKADQTAIFIGLPEGTEYGVRETSSGLYIQLVPESAEGYTGKTVTDSVEVIPFVNGENPPIHPYQLMVKKVINDYSEDASAPKDAEFTFRISSIDGEGNAQPLNGAAYDIVNGDGISTFVTDENGVFTIKAWDTARFLRLRKNTTYLVEELQDQMPEGFRVGGESSKQGLLEEDPIEFVFENNFTEAPNQYLSIRKVNNEGKDVPDAVLQVYKLVNEEEVVVHNWTSKTSAEEFRIDPGTYYIREVEPPEGYLLLEKEIEVVVPEPDENDPETLLIEIEVKNVREWELEGTGGSGTKWFYIAGAAIVLIGAAGLIYGKKRNLKTDNNE